MPICSFIVRISHNIPVYIIKTLPWPKKFCWLWANTSVDLLPQLAGPQKQFALNEKDTGNVGIYEPHVHPSNSIVCVCVCVSMPHLMVYTKNKKTYIYYIYGTFCCSLPQGWQFMCANKIYCYWFSTQYSTSRRFWGHSNSVEALEIIMRPLINKCSHNFNECAGIFVWLEMSKAAKILIIMCLIEP